MKTWVRKTLSVGVLAAGALLFAPGAAHAAVDQSASDNNGVLNATQLVAPISVPLNVAGLGIGVAGEGTGAGVASSRHSTESGHVGQHSWNNNGVLNGTQAYVPIDVPVNVAGIGVGVLGEGTGSGVATSGGKTESGHVGQHSSNNNGALNGTQIFAPIQVPVNIAGIGIGVAGEGTGSGVATSGRKTESGQVGQHSSNNNGALNGTQIFAPVHVPVNIAGIGIGVAGEGTGAGVATESGHQGGGVSQSTSDNNGVGNGTQVVAPIDVPVNVCGIGVGILGSGTGQAVCTSGKGGHQHHGGGGNTGGDNGGGNTGGDNGGDTPGTPGGGNPGSGDVGGDHGSYGDAPRGEARSASTEALPTDGLLSTAGLDLNGLGLLN